jgi:glycosyltransferase involved in cell wall biosynthesis
MKVAIHNEFFGENVAETELSNRICLAAKNLGWIAIEVSSSLEINQFNPDFVLVLHYRTPKLSGFPTYGCMWNPIQFSEDYEAFTQQEKLKENILSYDSYLSSSPQIDTWLNDILYGTNKNFFIAPFYTSCHQTKYQMPSLENPRLFYAGINWDGQRFKDLFRYLDTKDYMDIYGPKTSWEYLNHSYKGSLPFDGSSVLNALHKAGIGLCLHKDEHRKSATPSMRIFEIVASGAIAICEDHAFIKQSFGNSVFYIDPSLSAKEKSNQISKYVRWIQGNHQQALDMSAQAHKIFTEKYSLENLLLGILPHHQKLIKDKGFSSKISASTLTIDTTKSNKLVEIIVRIGSRDKNTVKRCLNSIANQTYKNIGVILVKYKELDYLDSLLKEYEKILSIKMIETEFTGFRSTQLLAGVNAVNADYFGVLDDDDLIHVNHIYSLVSLLEKYDEVGVAFSGSICVWEDKASDNVKKFPLNEPAKLANFEPFDINKMVVLKNHIVSNSFVARKSLISEDLRNDPKLIVAEDMFLLLAFCRKTNFVFSYEATCEFYWRYSKKENSTFDNPQVWEESAKRIRYMFWKKSFPASRFMMSPTLIDVESNLDSDEQLRPQLQHYLNVIEAMQSSKFWKLRNTWIRIKKLLKMPTEDQII